MPAWVVVGTQIHAYTEEPILCVAPCCEEHLLEVQHWQSQWEPAFTTEIEALPLVLDEFGAEVFWPMAASA